MHRFRQLWLALALGILGVSCAEDDKTATAIAVVVRTDLGQDLGSVQVRVFDPEADPRNAQPLHEFTPQPISELSKPTVITTSSRTEFLIAVQGFGLAGKAAPPLVEQHVRTRVVQGKTIVTPVFLARACLKKSCAEAPNQTCNGQQQGSPCEGSCGAVPLVEPAGTIESDSNTLPTASWQRTTCPMPTPPSSCDGGMCCDGGQCSCDGSSTCDAGVCSPSLPEGSCNLVTQCGCGQGEGCYARLESGKAIVECSPVGRSREGTGCSVNTDCMPGLGCINETCNRFCEKTSDCGTNSTCSELAFGKGDARVSLGRGCSQNCKSNADCSTNCCSGGICKPTLHCEPEAPSCPAAAGDAACTTCGKSQCCTYRSACLSSNTCQAYVSCLNSCTNSSCESSCAQSNSAGAAIFQAYSSCMSSRCSSACRASDAGT